MLMVAELSPGAPGHTAEEEEETRLTEVDVMGAGGGNRASAPDIERNSLPTSSALCSRSAFRRRRTHAHARLASRTRPRRTPITIAATVPPGKGSEVRKSVACAAWSSPSPKSNAGGDAGGAVGSGGGAMGCGGGGRLGAVGSAQMRKPAPFVDESVCHLNLLPRGRRTPVGATGRL
jgi:hypothetical protein